MKYFTSQRYQLVKEHKILASLLGVVLVLLSWWAYTNFMPHPLGEKMEYLGKEDYGNVFGFDYHPYSVYYYGTDIEPEDMAGYFGAELEWPIENKLTYIDVNLTKNGRGFYLTYKTSDTFKTSKKYVVSIKDEYYSIAKKYYQR